MTSGDDHSPRHPKDGEAQASLRAEILQQIAVAQVDIERALAQIPTGDARIPLAVQLANLSAIRQQVSLASPATLTRMQSEASAAIATAQALTDASASTSVDADPKSLAVATAEARRTVQSFVEDYYEKRKFDQYLEFSSEEDERAYREREKKRQAEIEKALADGTPEATRHANELALEQLRDAGKHGADRSLEYQTSYKQLEQSEAALHSSINGAAADRAANAAAAEVADAAPRKTAINADIGAALKSAGVVVADQSQTGHGVTVDASIAAALGRA